MGKSSLLSHKCIKLIWTWPCWKLLKWNYVDFQLFYNQILKYYNTGFLEKKDVRKYHVIIFFCISIQISPGDVNDQIHVLKKYFLIFFQFKSFYLCYWKCSEKSVAGLKYEAFLVTKRKWNEIRCWEFFAIISNLTTKSKLRKCVHRFIWKFNAFIVAITASQAIIRQSLLTKTFFFFTTCWQFT